METKRGTKDAGVGNLMHHFSYLKSKQPGTVTTTVNNIYQMVPVCLLCESIRIGPIQLNTRQFYIILIVLLISFVIEIYNFMIITSICSYCPVSQE